MTSVTTSLADSPSDTHPDSSLRKRYRFYIPTIECASCSSIITNFLENELNIKKEDYLFDYLDKTLIIYSSDADCQTKIPQSIKDIGHEAQLLDASVPEDHSLLAWRSGLASIPGAVLLILCLSGIAMPFYALLTIAVVSLPIMVFSGWDIFKDTFTNLFINGAITMDSLFTLSAICAFVVSLVALFMPALGLPIFFEAGLMIIGFRNLGRYIDANAKAGLQKGIKLVDRTPVDVEKLVGNNLDVPITRRVNVSDIEPGQQICVREGEMIPVDGKMVRGSAMISQKVITGDVAPSLVTSGSLLAGQIVERGELILQASHRASDSFLARLDAQIESARESKPEIELVANTIVKYFVPVIISIAIVAAISVGFFVGVGAGIATAVSVLVASCPCVFGFLISLLVKLGLSKAAEHGAYFGSGRALQELDRVDTAVLDMTGTLTQGQHELVSITCDAPWNESSLLPYLIALEAQSEHTLARSLRAYAGEVEPVHTVIDVTEQLGLGVCGSIDGAEYAFGNLALMHAKHVDISSFSDHATEAGTSAHYVAKDGKVIAVLQFVDKLKPDAAKLISHLHERGMQVILCTGSEEQKALSIARQVGIDHEQVKAGCLPGPKQQLIESLQNEGKVVAMIGDGENDSAAISRANVGIVMRSGCDVSRDNADIIVNDQSMQPLMNAFTISSQMMACVYQSLIFNIIFNSLVIAFAAGGLIALNIMISPALFALGMVVASSLAMLNVYRFKCQEVADEGVLVDPLSFADDTASARHELDHTLSLPPRASLTSTADKSVADRDELSQPRADDSVKSSTAAASIEYADPAAGTQSQCDAAQTPR